MHCRRCVLGAHVSASRTWATPGSCQFEHFRITYVDQRATLGHQAVPWHMDEMEHCFLGIPMTKIERLEQDIMALDRSELAALRGWFQRYLADEWDKSIEEDAKADKFERLAGEALADHRAGRTKPL